MRNSDLIVRMSSLSLRLAELNADFNELLMELTGDGIEDAESFPTVERIVVVIR